MARPKGFGGGFGAGFGVGRYRYALAPWQWDTGGVPNSTAYWRPPALAAGWIDLRPVPAQAQAGGTPQGHLFGAFVSPHGGDQLAEVLDFRDCAVTPAMRDAWETRLGYRPDGADLVDLLWDQLTAGADPAGEAGPKPLMPGTDGLLKLVVPGHSVVRSEKFVWGEHPHTEKVRAVLHRDFAGLWEGTNGSDHARRVLDYQRVKYRLKGDGWRELVPARLRAHVPGPLPHQTTITDNFNRANADALGSSSEGWSWTETAGDADIVSNAARAESDPAEARAESDLSGGDHYSQASVVGSPNQFRDHCVCVRFDSGARSFYYSRARDQNTGTVTTLKMVTGTPSSLAGPTTGIGSIASATIYLEINGSGLDFKLGGVSKQTVTDTTFSGQTRTGLRWENWSAATPHSLDNFQAADLGAPAGGLTFRPQWAKNNRLLGGGVLLG